jgi:hypothetical protein
VPGEPLRPGFIHKAIRDAVLTLTGNRP